MKQASTDAGAVAADLQSVTFFENHPVFAITSPEPFAYGKDAQVRPDEPHPTQQR